VPLVGGLEGDGVTRSRDAIRAYAGDDTGGAVRMFEGGEQQSTVWKVKVTVYLDYDRVSGNGHVTSEPTVEIHTAQ
jgi:hypothetical protein